MAVVVVVVVGDQREAALDLQRSAKDLLRPYFADGPEARSRSTS